jgi:hypothetical protein
LDVEKIRKHFQINTTNIENDETNEILIDDFIIDEIDNEQKSDNKKNILDDGIDEDIMIFKNLLSDVPNNNFTQKIKKSTKIKKN